MKSLSRFLTSLFSAAMLLTASSAFAQSSFFNIDPGFSGEPIPTADGRFLVDSFFDVDYQINACDPCEAIRNEIDRVMAEIEGLETDLGMLDELMTALEADMTETDNQLENAQERLDEFNDPQNYVESEGRRYDSSDHAAMQRRSSNLWGAYQDGDLSAQEYSDEIAKPFDDPDVQRELEKLKKEIRKEMEQKIKDLKKTKADQEEKHQEWDALGQEMTAELDALEAELAELQQALEDCLKLCTEPESVDLTDPFGLPVPEPGFFESLFGGLFGPPPILPPLPPLPPLPGSAGGDIPTELLPMGLSGPPPVLPLPDPFFEAPQLPPPTCHLCDPIREQIQEIEDSLADLEWDQFLADAMVDVLYEEKANREQRKDQLEQELDRLQNPPEFVESEGRRYDSTDHAAMKVRNARLWGEYKAGRLSAQDLSDEWEKDFDDPDVQEELEDIKEQLEEELEDQIEELEDQIEELDEEIEELNDELVDLAGTIAAHKKVLEFLYQDLEECKKKCVLAPAPDTVLIPDFDQLVQDIGVSLRMAVGEIETSDDVEDDMDMVIPPSELEQDGYFCRVPLLRNFTCKTTVEDEDDIDEVDDEDDMDMEVSGGFFCNSLGVFCPKQEYMLNDVFGCLENSQSPTCDELVPGSEPQFFLEGITGVQFPLIISGFDGNDTFDPADIEGLGGCIAGGPQNCAGLDFGLPDNDVLFGDDLIGTPGGDFRVGLRGPGGDDILLGDPVNRDLINVGGGSNDMLRGGPGELPDDLIGPGGDDIIGGPPGVGLFGENGNDLIGDPPPPPTQPEQNMQNDPQVRQVVQAAVKRYLQQNPLQECEKLQVQVSRVRIGNRVRYTVRITRIRDESLCPPPPIAECPAETSYQSIGTGCEACQNGGAGCVVVETLPDGINCIVCAPPSDTDDEDDIGLGCQYDSDCNDGDECTDDRCDRYTGECSNVEREGCRDPVCGDGVKQPSEECEGDNDSSCNSNEYCSEQCTCEPKPTPKKECPDIAHENRTSCEASCSGGCLEMSSNPGCYICEPKDLPPASSSSSQKSVVEQCDSPTMKKADCERSCDGNCDRAYTTISGLECYECMQAPTVCGDGNVDPGEECDLYGCDNGYHCAPNCTCQEDEDFGPSCPDGMTDSLSDCQSQCGAQGGTCVDEDQTGCYSCVVVNCPDGSSKECPSSCSNGCEKVGEQYGVSCYQCKQSCEDVCAQNGYGGPNTDHSSAILSELNGYSCVSGASISIQTATIGSCSCIGEYSLSVNQTPPVCTGTPCGDVTCGDSATCTEGDTTITVNCNWGGWEQIDKHQFRPVVGN